MPAIATIHRRWGTHALAVGAQDLIIPERSALPTGFPELDQALVCGGLPTGAMTELAGPPTSGLHTLALSVMAQAQARGLPAVYLDLGSGFTPAAAVRRGVRLADLLLLCPSDTAAAAAMPHAILRYGGGGVLVVDTTAPRLGIVGIAGLIVRLPQLRPTLARTGWALVILIPLSYEDAPFSAVTLPHADMRVRAHREQWICAGRQVTGYTTSVSIVKQPHGPSISHLTITIGCDWPAS
ncbi:MAG TPA: hypothetical protein VFO07_10570 [Roseiflexaceae bacterium]|nr:hypothetical protein [Roseiflexaceae bacterium]